eukprot:7099356-Pyramimonas_sp.AAC.1
MPHVGAAQEQEPADLVTSHWDLRAADCWQRVHGERFEDPRLPHDGAELFDLDREAVLDDFSADLQVRLWASAFAREDG